MTRAPARQFSDIAIARINSVLFERWDPIGVNDTEVAKDEYLSYAPEIYSFLARGEPADFIGRHLDFLASTRMGVGAHAAQSLAVASELKALWQRLQFQSGKAR